VVERSRSSREQLLEQVRREVSAQLSRLDRASLEQIANQVADMLRHSAEAGRSATREVTTRAGKTAQSARAQAGRTASAARTEAGKTVGRARAEAEKTARRARAAAEKVTPRHKAAKKPAGGAKGTTAKKAPTKKSAAKKAPAAKKAAS
jgi:hypothetical protein